MISGLREFILFVYWGLGSVLFVLALVLPKKWLIRSVLALIVIGLFSYYPIKLELQVRAWKQQRSEAIAHFRKRCAENAGERISQVVTNVEGIYLAKPRWKASDAELSNQFWMGDPYGYSSYEAEYPAETYLYDRSGITVSPRRLTPIKGYAFVEMNNPDYAVDNGRPRYLRYVLKMVDVKDGDEIKKRPMPVAQGVNKLRSRYAITWNDISTEEDRRHWVAGGRLRVIDMQTDSAIAERVGYMVDPQLGAGAAGRVIWEHVNHIRGAVCPPFESDFDKNKEFVAKALRASEGGRDVK